MQPITSINVRLSREELSALQHLSQRELRHPRDQARYLLRLALGLDSGADVKHFSTAVDVQDQAQAVGA